MPDLWSTIDNSVATAAKVYSRKLELETVKSDAAARAWLDGAHTANQVQRNTYSPDPSPQRALAQAQDNSRIALYLAGGAVLILSLAGVMAVSRRGK